MRSPLCFGEDECKHNNPSPGVFMCVCVCMCVHVVNEHEHTMTCVVLLLHDRQTDLHRTWVSCPRVVSYLLVTIADV